MNYIKTELNNKLLIITLFLICNMLVIYSANAGGNQNKGQFISSKMDLLSDQQNKQLAIQLNDGEVVATAIQSIKRPHEFDAYKKFFNLTLTATPFKMEKVESEKYRDFLDVEMRSSKRIEWAYPEDSDAGIFTTLSVQAIDNKNLIVESIVFTFDYDMARKSNKNSMMKFVESGIWYIVLRKNIKITDMDNNASPAVSLFPVHKELVKLGISKFLL